MLEALPEHVLGLLGLQADVQEAVGLLRGLSVKGRDGLLIVRRGDFLEHCLEFEVRAQAEHEESRALRAYLGRDAPVALGADEHGELVVAPSEVEFVDLLLVAGDRGSSATSSRIIRAFQSFLYSASLPRAVTFL